MSTESKRLWRQKNPDRYAEYERRRAQARREGYWGDRWGALAAGREPRESRSSDSYYRYEHSTKRLLSTLRRRIREGTDQLERWQSDLDRLQPELERVRALFHNL